MSLPKKSSNNAKGISLIAFLLIGGSILLWQCTGNYRARYLGGSQTINLPAGQKLMNVTWKDNEIWYLTQPMSPNEVPVTSTFHEKSSKGVLEGTIIINESK